VNIRTLIAAPVLMPSGIAVIQVNEPLLTHREKSLRHDPCSSLRVMVSTV